MAKKKYVDYEGLRYYNEKLQEIIDAKAGGADVSNQLAALNTKIDNTKQTLETSIGTTNTNLSNLQSSVDVSISALQSKDTQHETAISALQTKDGQQDTAISNLQGKDTTHDTQIASLVNKDTELGTSISALQTKDGQHDSAIANLSSIKADKTEVTREIATAVAGVTQFDYLKVDELPEEGVKGVIYLVLSEQGSEGDIYQEWIWIESEEKFETLGFTNNIDLSNYVTFEDTISNSDIDSLFVRSFNLLFKYSTINQTFNEYNMALDGDNFEFNEDYFTKYGENNFIPSSNEFILKASLLGTEVTIPNDHCTIAHEGNFYNLYYVSEELQALIAENGGSLMGMIIDLTFPAGCVLLNGVPNAARHAVFTYGEEIDGHEYPSDNVLIDLTSPDTRAEGTWYVISNMKETAQKMEDYYQGGTGEIPVTLKVDNDNTYDLTFASSEEGGPKATENIQYNGTEYKVFTTWDVSNEEVSIILQENE